jgi:tetratricopeptide (TPR) repeat protein
MRWLPVCALAACACGPALATSPAASTSPGSAQSRDIVTTRPDVEIRRLEIELHRDIRIEPENVSFVPAVRIVGGEGQDIDEQIEAHGRLLDAGISGVERVEHWAVLGELYTRRGDHALAAQSYERAIRLREFKKYKRADEVLFRRFDALRRAGDLISARKAVVALIKDYPSSSWIADSYLAFGDHFFDAGSPDKARQFYEKAVQFRQSRTSAYAHYKLAWVHYRGGAYRDALEQFYESSRSSLSSEQRLRDAAQRGFVYAYVEVGRPQRAYAALRRLNREGAPGLAVLLAEVYAQRGEHDKAIAIYRALAAEERLGDASCEWQLGIVSMTVASGTKREVRAEVRELAEHGAQCDERVRQQLSALVRAWLAEAEPAPAQSERFAVDIVELYLQGFPRAPDAGELSYYLADRLWHRAVAEADMAAAVQAWTAVAERFERAIRIGGLEPAQLTDAEAALALARSNAGVAAARAR